MGRRTITLLLTLLVLLTQWVNLHRRYDGCAACGRPPAPHVRLSELVPFAERPPSCRCKAHADADDRGCCHRQASGDETPGAGVAEPFGPVKGCCADVLLVSADSGVTLASTDSPSEDPESALDAFAQPGVRSADDRRGQAGVPCSPPRLSSAPLYLLNRALLI